MLQSLLTIHCGKNGTKRKKVLQVLNSMSYNEQTKEYSCKSTRMDKTYVVFYSEKSNSWLCDCEANTYKDYKIYETLEDRKKYKKSKNDCIHIIAGKLYNYIKNEGIQLQ